MVLEVNFAEQARDAGNERQPFFEPQAGKKARGRESLWHEVKRRISRLAKSELDAHGTSSRVPRKWRGSGMRGSLANPIPRYGGGEEPFQRAVSCEGGGAEGPAMGGEQKGRLGRRVDLLGVIKGIELVLWQIGGIAQADRHGNWKFNA